MNISSLPENPKSSDERFHLLDKLKKQSRELDRTQVEQQILNLSKQEVGKLTFSLAHVLAGYVLSQNFTHTPLSERNWFRYFLENCDEKEIRWCDEQFETICRVYADGVSTQGQKASLQAVGSLMVALRKRTSGAWNELTSIHTDFLQVCLVAKTYTIATHLANLGSTSLASRKDGSPQPKTLPLDLQRYFYYSGIAFCGTLQFKDACSAFLQCLSLPAKGFGAVHQEAYKKFVLCSLITHGKLLPLPRYVPSSVSKSLSMDRSKDFANYRKLAAAFEKLDQGEDLFNTLQDTALIAEFEEGGNMGLLSQVSDAYMKSRIVKLTGTYVTLRFGEIASTLGIPLEKIEAQLLKMIQGKQIRATLDQQTGTVRFLSESEDPEEQAKAVNKIENEIEKVRIVSQELRNLDIRLSTSKTFISHLTLRSGVGVSANSTGDAMMMDG